ncbi:MAG: hypothetical protein H6753_02865 [Candidatus Omnitrophica bacterium]|nr:hypothetical protein [Candidatus Omnitrophota bacterium]
MLPVSKDIPNEIKILDVFMKLKADIVYFGDSTINWAPDSDVNRESMPGLLQRLLPTERIAKITHASYQMDVYQAYVEYMIRKGYHPKVVIIPINLRCFSPEWDQQPLWQFEKEKLTLAMKDTFWMKFYRPLAVFKIFEPRINRFAYEQTNVFDGSQLIGQVRDFDNASYQVYSQEKMKNKLRFRYMYSLSKQHRKVQSMVRSAKLLKSAGIKPVFYITPVDWQTIEKNLGVSSVLRIEENVQVIRSALDEVDVPVWDLSRSLPSEDFSWPEDGDGPYYPNEHLRLRGRMLVVKTLAERMILPERENLPGQN